MVALRRNKPERQRDELAQVRFFLRWMQVWPEDRDTWWRRLYFFCYMTTCTLATLLEILFVITESKNADPLILLQVATDAIGTGSFVYKGIYARNNAKSFLKISALLRTDFAKLEQNHCAIQIPISKLAWLPSVAHFGLAIASVTKSIAAFWQPPEIRQCSFIAPPFWNANPYTFYPMWAAWIFSHNGMYPSNSSLDAIVVCLTNLIREKALTCQALLKDLEQVKDKRQLDAEMNKVIEYHTLLMHVYEVTEDLTNRPMLIQFIFLLVGIGTPTLTLLLSEWDFDSAYLMFLSFYVIWIISAVFVYFLTCDAATASAQGIGFAAYQAYRPGMTKDQVRKLCCIMVKAQRPMFFTARKLIKMDRRAMLKMVKKSYSIYSTILHIR